MRLDKYNRYMATVRSPKFLKEWKILSEIQDRGEYDTWKTWMAEKWGDNLLRPIPSYVDHYNSSFDYTFANLYPAAVEKIDIEKATTITTTFPQVELKAVKQKKLNWQAIDPLCNADKKTKSRTADNCRSMSPEESKRVLASMQAIYSYQGGRYLYLKVDLTKIQKDIMAEFKDIISRYKGYLPEDSTRLKGNKYNIWKVYDMRHDFKLKPVEIARMLSGEEGNPSYNSKLRAALEKVTRADKKAKEMIDQVSDEAEKRAKHLIHV